MTVKVTGNYPVLARKRTGLFSLDVAIANGAYLGYPMRTATEIYGYPNVGKSTLSYYLSAKLAESGRIVICDLEMLDRNYIEGMYNHLGFDGEVKLVDSTDAKGKPISHEIMLKDMRNSLGENGTRAAIWDSLAAGTSIAETEGDFGEAFWGKRAKLNNQVARSIGSVLKNKDEDACFFAVNHVQGVMGGKGHTTPGGEQVKFVAATRIMLWTEEVWKATSESDSDVIGFLVSGQVEKLRFGGRGKKFRFYIIPGYGVHVGASAM